MVFCTPNKPPIEQSTQQNIISVGQFTIIHKLNNRIIRKVPLDKSYIYSLQAIEIEAVTFIHSKTIIHSDLSARQFLVSPNGKDIRLSDFGGSSLHGSDAIVMENATHFLPRDEDAPNTVLSDLFVLGSTLYEIFVGRKPYEGVGDGEVQRLFGGRVFPTLEEEVEDERWRRGIWKCWMCEYEQAVDILGG